MPYYTYTPPVDSNDNLAWIELGGRWVTEKLTSIGRDYGIVLKQFKNDIIYLENNSHEAILERYGISLYQIDDKERDMFIAKILALMTEINDEFDESKTYIDALSRLLEDM